MVYNPFKYWYHRTMYYLRQPIPWLLDAVVMLAFALALIVEGRLNGSQILLTVVYLVWKTFRGICRFVVSLIVCFAAKHHEGFKQEYYECVNPTL